MSKWYVSVGMSLSIDYDDIEADTKEKAEPPRESIILSASIKRIHIILSHQNPSQL